MNNYKLMILTAALTLAPSMVAAQLINRPYAFKHSPDGLGMSVGGRQAIMNEKLLGSRPDNLLRSPSGALLDVREGPGKTAVVSYQGTGETIPQYRGTSFRGDNSEMGVGVFNAFFSPSGGGGTGFSGAPNLYSGATVSTWTARVVSGGAPVSYQGINNPVETWTGQVFLLGVY